MSTPIPNDKAYERICDECRRLKVPGGWIYEHWRYVFNVNNWEPYATTFVPEPSSPSKEIKYLQNRIIDAEALILSIGSARYDNSEYKIAYPVLLSEALK